MKIFLRLFFLGLSFVFCSNLRSILPASQQPCVDVGVSNFPGSKALKDLCAQYLNGNYTKSKKAVSIESFISNKKFKSIDELYEAYNLYFYEQEKLAIQRLFEAEGIAAKNLKNACAFWHDFQKECELAEIKKSFENNSKLQSSIFFEIMKEAILNFGFKVENFEFLKKKSAPNENSFLSFIIEDFFALAFPNGFSDEAGVEVYEREEFKYIISHELEHTKNRDFETASFLCSLGNVVSKSFDLEKNSLVSDHRKLIEERAYILAAIKTTPFSGIKYIKTQSHVSDKMHPKASVLEKKLNELQKVMEQNGFVEPIPNFVSWLRSFFVPVKNQAC